MCHDLIDQKAKEKTFNSIQEELHKSIGREQHLALKLKIVEQKCVGKEYDYSNVKEELNKEQCENVKFINTMRRASAVIKQLQDLEYQNNKTGKNIETHEKRQELLDYLEYIFIFSSEPKNVQTSSVDNLSNTGDMYKNADTESEVNFPTNKMSQYSFDEDTIEMVSFTKSRTDRKGESKPMSECSTQKSEDEISEEIIVQEDGDMIDLCSRDFSKASEMNTQIGSEQNSNQDIIIQSSKLYFIFV